ncbi:MAG: WYL domain-containing protein [Gammaproteobacteria bacterium]|nr:WYL domain-containing protein [Gammaproteobacteria bacterium]
MDRTERFYRLDQLLQERRVVPMETLIGDLEVSRATVKRDLEYLRDRLNAPIVWDREHRGYRYEVHSEDPPRYVLPGLWFNATEVHALLTMEQLLADLQPGLLSAHIEPLRTRIRVLLESVDHSAEAIENRVRILHTAVRPVRPELFQAIASATLGRTRLVIEHYNRSTDETLEREVSPQRIVYYRDTWYLDTWCHLRKGLRSFSMDAIGHVSSTGKKARNVAEAKLKAFFEEGYGIFSGQASNTAVLRFSATNARWVAKEVWHPRQQGEFDADGRYELRVPYSVDTEIIMDILRHGPEVEVLAPPSLRHKVRERLAQAGAVYGD